MSTNRGKITGEKLRKKEFRDAFAAEHIDSGVAFQIHALRERHNLSQAELAKRAGMHQSQISKLENPEDDEGVSLATLQRIASAFDVALVVRFVSFGELLEWETNLSNEVLAPPDYANDPRLAERPPAKTRPAATTYFAWLPNVAHAPVGVRETVTVKNSRKSLKLKAGRNVRDSTGTSELWLR